MSKISAPKIVKKAAKFDPAKFIAKQAKVHQELEDLVEPHVSSFNFCLEEGLRLAVADLDKVEYEDENFRAAWWFENVAITKPEDPISAVNRKVYPNEVIH